MEITRIGTGFRGERSAAAAVPARESVERKGGDIVPSSEVLQVGARLKLALGGDRRIIAVAGTGDQDGSSLLTASLGAALANLDQNPVLIVDGNTQGSKLASILGVTGSPGLLELLQDRTELIHVARLVSSSNLFFLPLGQSNQSMASLLGSPRCSALIDQMRRLYRYILVDCGAVCESADNMLLASLSDGLVTAVAATRRRDEIVRFQQSLQSLKISSLGIVITKGVTGR